MESPRILAFAGSLRTESYNKKVLTTAIAGAIGAGAAVTRIDLRDFPLPVYDGDLEAESGVPANALTLKKLFIESGGLLLACPEYNSSISGVFKNTIDWVSRPVPNEPSLAAFDGKIVSLMSASPGALGGLRGLVHVRAILAHLGCIVLPAQVSLSRASEAWTTDGQLKDAAQKAKVEKLGAALANAIRKFHS